MTHPLWNSLNIIGDDLIAQADADLVQAHFKRRRRRMKCVAAGLAACICLTFCFPIVKDTVFNYSNRIDISSQRTHGGSQSVSSPWGNAIAYEVSTQKSIYKPSETPVLELSYGLENDRLGEGILEVRIKTGRLTTTADTVYRHEISERTDPENMGADAHYVRIPLCAPDEWVYGSMWISFYFYPANSNHPIWQQSHIDEDGAVCMESLSIEYAANEFETAFWYGYIDDSLEAQQLLRTYRKHRISRDEFAERYYTLLYQDTVMVYMTFWEGAYNFSYTSQNIRYKGTMEEVPEEIFAIFDTDWESVLLPGNEVLQKAARFMLDYMLSEGILTQAEYDSEIVSMEGVSNMRIASASLPLQSFQSYQNLLREYEYTH